MKTPFDILEFFVETEDKDTGLGKIDRLVIQWLDKQTEKVYDNTEADKQYLGEDGQLHTKEFYNLKAMLNSYLMPYHEIIDAYVERTHHPKVITFTLLIKDAK